MAENARISSKGTFFTTGSTSGSTIEGGGEQVFVSPPAKLTGYVPPPKGAVGKARRGRTESVNYVTVVNPTSGKTDVYLQEYNLLGQRQQLDPDKKIASRNADGTYEPTEWAQNKDNLNPAILNSLVNNERTQGSLDNTRNYTWDNGKTQQNGGTPPTAVEKAAFRGDSPDEQSGQNPNNPANGGQDGDDGTNQSTDLSSSLQTGDIQGLSASNASLKADLYYPLNSAKLETDYIKFSALEYKPAKVSNASFAVQYTENTVIGKSVYLPLQGTLSDTNSVGWNEESLNAGQIMQAGVAMGAIEGGGSGLKNEVSKALSNISDNSGATKKAISAMITNSIIGTNILPRESRAIFNPNTELLFQGPQLRSFSFTFKLTARNEPEADVIKQIIRFFKINMAAKKTKSQLFLKAPNVFRLEYIHKSAEKHPGINMIKDCGLQSFNVDYTPDGSYMTVGEKGTMFSYSINLTFMELLPLYSTDYEEGNAKNHPIGY